MAAFNHEHEFARLAEKGLTSNAARQSLESQIGSLIAERTGQLHASQLLADLRNQEVTAVGFEQRGDITNSYHKSVDEARDVIIKDRFALENKGYDIAQKMFFDLPPYSTVILFSPPPEHDMKALGYADYSLAYFYHILPGEDKNKRTIKALSWIHHFSNEDMAKIINQLSLSYIVDPTTESILTSPVGLYASDTGTGSLQTIWKEIRRVYKSTARNFVLPPYEVIEEYLLFGDEVKKRDHPVLSAMIEEMARLYQKGKMTKELEEQWRIMLNFADQDLLHQDISTPQRIYTQTLLDRRIIPVQPEDLFWHYRNLSYEPRAVATSCGSSGEDDSLRSIIPQFTKDTPITTRTFEVAKQESKDTCSTCGEHTKDRHYHCPDCQKKYTDETNVQPEQRTKKCACGFAFGC